jgi:hypothetical protein
MVIDGMTGHTTAIRSVSVYRDFFLAWMPLIQNSPVPNLFGAVQRNARETSGEEMRKRLEELNWRTRPHSPEVVAVFDGKASEVMS